MKRSICAVAAATMLMLPAVANAHVSAVPAEQPAGGYTELQIRVPNEKTESTTSVQVQIPEGAESVRVQPVPGWTYKTEREGENVTSITWSGGEIRDGEYQNFPISMRMPDGDAGDVVFFPAIQTYDGGEEVSWIQTDADAGAELESPAPAVTLTEAAAGGHGASATTDTADDEKSADAAADEDDDKATDDGAPMWLAIAALVIALGALIVAFVRTRK